MNVFIICVSHTFFTLQTESVSRSIILTKSMPAFICMYSNFCTCTISIFSSSYLLWEKTGCLFVLLTIS